MSYLAFQPRNDRAEQHFATPPPRMVSSGTACHTSDRLVAGAEKILESVEFMRQRLDQPLQAGTLAARVNISQSHYFALFKRVTGLTPIDYFTRLRIQRACVLLSEPSARVKCVAAAVGYEDPFYFSRVFKSIQGVAPSDYRNQQAESRPHDVNTVLPVPFGRNENNLRHAENSPCKT